jgi:hypothetical protein
MPFIEQKYRPALDWYIKDAEDGKLWEALLGLQKTLEDTLVITSDVRDGALNYTICQLYRKCDIAYAESITIMLINHFYLENPRYTKIKDTFGLIDAIVGIFESGEISTILNPVEDIKVSLLKIYKHVNANYIRYEVIKKTQNGDLQ